MERFAMPLFAGVTGVPTTKNAAFAIDLELFFFRQAEIPGNSLPHE